MNSWNICDGRGWIQEVKGSKQPRCENWGTEVKGNKSFFKDCKRGPSLSDPNKPRGMAEEGWFLARVTSYDAESTSQQHLSMACPLRASQLLSLELKFCACADIKISQQMSVLSVIREKKKHSLRKKNYLPWHWDLTTHRPSDKNNWN